MSGPEEKKQQQGEINRTSPHAETPQMDAGGGGREVHREEQLRGSR